MTLDITGKRLELLKEALPGLTRVALLTNPREAVLQRRTIENLEREAAALNVTVRPYEARTPEDIDRVIPRMAQDNIQALYIGNDPMLFNERHRLAKLAITHNLPFQPTSRLGVLAGGFMSYGPESISAFRRVGYYADRILKGEKPGDLPIEQTDKFCCLIRRPQRHWASPSRTRSLPVPTN